MSHISHLFNRDKGRCFYCEGATWFAAMETAAQARDRFGIPSGVPGCRPALRNRKAFIDGDAHRRFLCCQFCKFSRGRASIEHHRLEMQELVARGEHPVNRKPQQAVAA